MRRRDEGRAKSSPRILIFLDEVLRKERRLEGRAGVGWAARVRAGTRTCDGGRWGDRVRKLVLAIMQSAPRPPDFT